MGSLLVMHLWLSHLTMPISSSGMRTSRFSTTSKSLMTHRVALGVMTESWLSFSGVKNMSAIFTMLFLPIFWLLRLYPMVTEVCTCSRCSRLTTSNIFSEGIWSITVPFLSAATCSSSRFMR